MKRILLAISSVILLVNGFGQTVSAHVLIMDNSGSIGAILHVAPDDDPVAGQPSSLYFDIQSQTFSQHQHSISLYVTDQQGQQTQIPITSIGNTARATYTFPVQGAYKLVLAANTKNVATDHTHTFTYTQRVSRGVAGSALDKPTYAWAEMLLIAGMVLTALLAITFLNRRKSIAVQSKW